MDAAIIFSDILMVPFGLGQSVEFKKNFGPFLGSINVKDIKNIMLVFLKKLIQFINLLAKLEKIKS